LPSVDLALLAIEFDIKHTYLIMLFFSYVGTCKTHAHASLFLAKGNLVMNWLEVMLTFSIGLAAHAPRGVGRRVVANINAPFPSAITSHFYYF
jgi:hypothetical protein